MVNLIKKSKQRKELHLRMNAVEALGRIGDKRAIEPLIQALKDKNHVIRRLAAKNLGEIGSRVKERSSNLPLLIKPC
ncbi:MAG: HEAT repeat domain-containing protein [Euryarchaeota archaeon]|nr:HEAT repeat domain-containing protein [Euryarchaeota archaeon]